MPVRQLINRSRTVRGIREDVRLLRTRTERRVAERERLDAERAARLARQERIDAYLAAHAVRRLQIGAGRTRLPGWLSTDLRPTSDDVVEMDATRRFPFPDDSFDVVFAEHMIEHVSWKQGQAVLAEALRVLRPGGVLRLATPDLAVLVGLYRGEAGRDGDHYVRWVTRRYLRGITHQHPVFVINNAVRNWGHTFVYDAETLALALADAGFTAVRRCAFGESEHPDLRGIESHGDAVADRRSVVFETMVLEATKPAG